MVLCEKIKVHPKLNVEPLMVVSGRDLVVRTDSNTVFTTGDIHFSDMRRLFAAINHLVSNKGYKDITLDMSDLSSAFPGPMLALAAITRKLLVDGIDTFLILPNEDRLKRLFMNTGWANLIDPLSHLPSNYKGISQIPAIVFKDGDEQFEAVKIILGRLLGALKDFDRSYLKAIEWSLNEISDNVINHAESPFGGILQVVDFSQRKKAIQFVVCDGGFGIPQTLRGGHPEIDSDVAALDRAIREGVTRASWAGQGNGLYGSWRIATISGGEFSVNSGFASLVYTPKYGLHTKSESIPFNGTLVTATIGYEKPLVLEEALQFDGKPHDPPYDFIEKQYGEDLGGNSLFMLCEESAGYGSRASGLGVRTKLLNLRNMTAGKVQVDLSNIHVISSSYADEVFGKLFVELGPIDFSNSFELRSMDRTVKQLIDRAISQRLLQSQSN